MVRKICLAIFGLLIPLGLLSCGSGGVGADLLKVYPVKGKITLAGNPVANANVIFSPVDTKTSRVATGKTNENGVYELTTYEGADGAAAGEYIVLVTKNTSSGGTGGEMSHDQYVSQGGPQSHGGGTKSSGVDSALPSKYASASSSDLKGTVKPEGGDSFDFDLKP